MYIDEIERFEDHTKERLMRFHGVSPEMLPLYLKELQFRYNNENKDLFDKIPELLRGGRN